MKMFNTQLAKLRLALLVAPLLLLAGVSASPASPRSADVVVPFSAKGNVAAVQAATNTGDTRLYSQNANGDIIQTCVSGPYTTGTTNDPSCGAGQSLNTVIVPANEVLLGTPIAAVDLNDTGFGDIRLYFLSQDNVLSEYIWQPSTAASGFRGGSSCSDCITNQGFVAVEGSQVLYAMGSTVSTRRVRVGFISAGTPGTITEAVLDGNNWQTAGLPN